MQLPKRSVARAYKQELLEALRMRNRITLTPLLIVAVVCAATFGNLNSTEPTTKWAAQKQVGRFHIHSDFILPDDEPLLGELLNISGEVSSMLAIPPDDQVIHIVLFESAKEYSRYLKFHFPKVPDRRALYIQRRSTGMLFAHWHTDVRVDIRHEVVHGILNSQSSPLPLWLDEGLAEYFEVVEEDRMHGNPYLSQVLSGVQQGYVPSLEDLERLVTIEQLGVDQYRDSWAWVHFLLHRLPETRQLLIQHLAQHRSSSSTLPLSRLVSHSMPDWRSEFTKHFNEIAARNAKREKN